MEIRKLVQELRSNGFSDEDAAVAAAVAFRHTMQAAAPTEGRTQNQKAPKYTRAFPDPGKSYPALVTACETVESLSEVVRVLQTTALFYDTNPSTIKQYARGVWNWVHGGKSPTPREISRPLVQYLRENVKRKKAVRIERSIANRKKASELIVRWQVPAQYARYRETGDWYEQPQGFPFALLDANGYVVFDDLDAMRQCPHIHVKKQVSIPEGISGIPGYVNKSKHLLLASKKDS